MARLDLATMVERALARFDHAIAASDGRRSLTYGELDRRSGRLANALTELTSGPGARVAILLPNSIEFIEADVATLRAGLAKVPLNPRLSADERAYIIEDSTAEILITDQANAEFARDALTSVGALRHLIVVGHDGVAGYERLLASAKPEFRRGPTADDTPSVILYTSGTTGRPKGALSTVRSRTAATLNMLVSELDLVEGDGMLHAGPLSHGSGSKVMAVLLRGARNLVMTKFDPDEFLRRAQDEAATSSFLVPTMISMLADAAKSRSVPRALRAISYGGAPITPAQLTRAIDVFGQVFIQVYGSCEAPHPVTVLSRDDHSRGIEEPTILTSAGRPSAMADVTIRSQEGTVLPAGTVGEICVEGAIVMAGYWGNADATAAAITGGVYRSGDLGYMDERRYLFLVDRARDLIISGGLNVYPAEVERVLAAHAAVLEVAVVGAPDDTWGEKVVAFVVPRPGHSISDAELTDRCREHLASYKKPRAYVFVESLPKGSTGKINKNALRYPF